MDLRRLDVARQEALALDTWMQSNGLEDESDLAFFFDNYATALQEGGRPVAEAWQAARARAEAMMPGVGRRMVMVEDALVTQQMASQAAAASRAERSQPSRPQRSRSPRRRAREREVGKPLRSQEVEREAQALLYLVLTKGRAEGQPARTLLERTEPPTLRRALRTYDELRMWAAGLGESPLGLSAHHFPSFTRSSQGPKRAAVALRWIRKNLEVDWDLGLLPRPKAKGDRYGQGARQAAVLVPLLIRSLNTYLGAEDPTTPDWAVLFGAYAMVFGCVRFRHLQRSRLVSFSGSVLNFWCSKGKTIGQRNGFRWSLPRYTSHGVDLAVVFQKSRAKVRQDNVMNFALVAMPSGKIGVHAFQMRLRAVLHAMLNKPEQLVTYSLRRVNATAAGMAELGEPDRLALGGWQDAGKVKSTPFRYDAARATREIHLKLAMHNTLLSTEAETWEELQATGYPQVFAASLREAQGKDQTLQWRDPQFTSSPLLSVAVKASWLAPRRGRRALTGSRPAEPAGVTGQRVSSQEMRDYQHRPVAPATTAKKMAKQKSRPLTKRAPQKPASQAVNVVLKQGPGSPRGPPEAPAEAAPVRRGSSQDLDKAFDALAGRREDVVPATVCYAITSTPGTLLSEDSVVEAVLLLGGMPASNDPALRQHRVRLFVSAMDRLADTVPSQVHAIKVTVSHQGRERAAAWKAALHTIRSTLANGESVLVHCVAGKHRSPILMATFLAQFRRVPFEEAYKYVQETRQGVEPWRVPAKVHAWAESTSHSWVFDQPKIPGKPQLLRSRRGHRAWHMSFPPLQEGGQPEPVCLWRQRPTSHRSSFQSGVDAAVDPFEAAAYGDTGTLALCPTCASLFPASWIVALKDITVVDS
ncbi:clpC [Symbiodinium natans]|uniref:ClpC protein n=1 Tax=Symbiodinium natans TaxID=878477 RepID=A0A812TQX2_9DINO|nr:clpC [Symbiodinium natans]